MCIDAMERGIHVLTEKPAALTLDELARLQDACARHPKVHLAGLMFSRYDPGFYSAHELVRSGAIGDVRLINARKSYKLGTRPGYYHDRNTYGGTIPWVGSHAIDWTMWMVNRPCKSVFATQSSAGNQGNGTMEMSALCQFAFEDEIAASVSVDYFRPSRAPTHGDDWIRIVGTRGVLEARPDSVKLINDENDGSAPVPARCDRKLVADFVNHVEGRRTALIDTRSTLLLTDACLRAQQSADQGRRLIF
jgi:predicted dehydrogenase